MKLFEEFKLYENLFEDAVVGKKHPWMKDVPLVYPELTMGSDPNDPEDDMLIKDFTYLEGPEDVAEVLDTLITEEDVAGTGYDFQTIKADLDVWYDFLDTNFDKLVTKYDEELLNAFEDRAIEAAIREAEDEYYNGNSEYIHESSEDNMARMRRQIRDEIAGYEIEKAFDPDNAWDYDEKIKACKAELAQLADLAPSKATLKRRAIKAEKEKQLKELRRRVKYAFLGLSSYFGHPKLIQQKNDGWLLVFKQMAPALQADVVDICAKAEIPVKYKEDAFNGSVFEVDMANFNITDFSSRWLDNIDHDAIEAKLKAEQENSGIDRRPDLDEAYYAVIEVDGKERRFSFDKREDAREYIAYVRAGKDPAFKGKKLGSMYTESCRPNRSKMKLHEEFKLYETMWEGLSKQCLKEAATDTVIITADSLGEKIIVAKKDLALAKKLDRKACDIWESAEERYQDEDELCARLGISAFSGVEIFDKLAAEAGLEWDLAELEALDKKGYSSGLNEWKAAANKHQQNLTWEELLEKADELLTELSTVSGNEDYDDGDGYWQEEYTVWCNRYLYYSDTLNNSSKLDKLCDDYSKKLPNVEFYYVEDEDICEIGYTATRDE